MFYILRLHPFIVNQKDKGLLLVLICSSSYSWINLFSISVLTCIQNWQVSKYFIFFHLCDWFNAKVALWMKNICSVLPAVCAFVLWTGLPLPLLHLQMNWPFQHLNFHLDVCIFTSFFSSLSYPALAYSSLWIDLFNLLHLCSNPLSMLPQPSNFLDAVTSLAPTPVREVPKLPVLLFPADDFNDNMLHPCASIHSKCFWEPFFRATCGLHHVCFHFHNCIFAHFTAFIQMCAFVQGSNYFHLWFPPSW